MRNLIACVKILLEAGANPCLRGYDTPQSWAVYFNQPKILAMLLAAGGAEIVDDIRDEDAGWTSLGQAARRGHAECCSLLLAAGADVNLRVVNSVLDISPLELAVQQGRKRVYAILLNAGATISPELLTYYPYFRKVVAAGGFRAYEKAHRQSLTNTFATRLPRLPTEVVSLVVSFAFHIGYY